MYIYIFLLSSDLHKRFPHTVSCINMRGTALAAQGGFFSQPEMMRNAVAQQSCSYLTPLLSRAGENPIHFQLLYLLTVDPESKHKGGRYPAQCTHTSSFHKTLGFNYLGGAGTSGEVKTAQNDFQELMLTQETTFTPLLSLLPASERIPSWPERSYSPQLVCSLGSTDLETQQSLSVWKPPRLKSWFNSMVNSWVRERGTFLAPQTNFCTPLFPLFVLLNTAVAPVFHLLCLYHHVYVKMKENKASSML